MRLLTAALLIAALTLCCVAMPGLDTAVASRDCPNSDDDTSAVCPENSGANGGPKVAAFAQWLGRNSCAYAASFFFSRDPMWLVWDLSKCKLYFPFETANNLNRSKRGRRPFSLNTRCVRDEVFSFSFSNLIISKLPSA